MTTYTEPTQAVEACQLEPGDEFPSHDGLIHTVSHVREPAGEGGPVLVLVDRSGGGKARHDTYEVEFTSSQAVQILA